MNIRILNRDVFNQFVQERGITNNNVKEIKDTFFISIKNIGDASTLKSNNYNVLELFFDDVCEPMPLLKDPSKFALPISQEQAQELYDFLLKNIKSKQAIIHCTAGVSRSGAVASFLYNTLLKRSYDSFNKLYPWVKPNRDVLEKLSKIHNQTINNYVHV